MKAEHLLDAMEYLDGELILEADEKPARRKLPVWRLVTAAAAVMVLCAGLYILPAMQPAGTAAPESQGTTNGLLEDVADSIVTDGSRDEYKYTTEQDTVVAPSLTGDGAVAGETVGGVFEPVFRTERGRYMLFGEELSIESELPDDVEYLGELVLTQTDEPVYPSVGTKELVGCAVWQSGDGEYLYIQNPAGGWLQATRSR